MCQQLVAPCEEAQSQPVGDGQRLQTHRLPLPLVAVGIHLTGKAVALQVLQIVEMSLVVFVNLLDACVQQKAVAYLYLFTVPVALDATA